MYKPSCLYIHLDLYSSMNNGHVCPCIYMHITHLYTLYGYMQHYEDTVGIQLCYMNKIHYFFIISLFRTSRNSGLPSIVQADEVFHLFSSCYTEHLTVTDPGDSAAVLQGPQERHQP